METPNIGPLDRRLLEFDVSQGKGEEVDLGGSEVVRSECEVIGLGENGERLAMPALGEFGLILDLPVKRMNG